MAPAIGLSLLSVTVPVSILEVGLTFLGVGSLDDPPNGSVNCAVAQLTKTVAIESATNNLFIATPRESYFLDGISVRWIPTSLRSLLSICTVISGLGWPLGSLMSAWMM